MGEGQGNATNGRILESFQAVALLHLVIGKISSMIHIFAGRVGFGRETYWMMLAFDSIRHVRILQEAVS